MPVISQLLCSCSEKLAFLSIAHYRPVIAVTSHLQLEKR